MDENEVKGWRPIASAPKGREVLVWREDSGPFIAKLATPDEVCTDYELAVLDFPDEYEEWFADAYGWQEGNERPTHWMPLPDGPAVKHQFVGDPNSGGGHIHYCLHCNAVQYDHNTNEPCAALRRLAPGVTG